MSKFLESVNMRHLDRRISEVVERLEEKRLYGTINLIKDLRYCLDLATKEKTHDCNCQHNNNSRDNEPCCRCNNTKTNADRIRNMSDEELACLIEKIKMCGGLIETERSSYECKGCKDGYCDDNVRQWLQSEAE